MTERRSLDELAAAVGALIEPIYGALEDLAAEVVACRRVGRRGQCGERDLAPLERSITGWLLEHPDLVGLGHVAAPGTVADQQRYLLWWQRAGDDLARLRLNFDPASVDVYDYLDMEWYRAAERGGVRNAFGPYVDYSGSGRYVITMSVPVVDSGEFVGVAGADLAMTALERQLIAVLRAGRHESVIVNDEPRVLAANTPRWLPGARLREPLVGRDGFVDVVPVPGGPGWSVASTGEDHR